jgi:hypothetical protein
MFGRQFVRKTGAALGERLTRYFLETNVPSGSGAGDPFGLASATVADSIQHQFHVAGNSQFVKDAEVIFLNGVFAESEFLSNRVITRSSALQTL